MYRWIEVMDHAPITMIDELERNCCILMHLTFVYSYITSLLVDKDKVFESVVVGK